ncbi:MAG TPA: tRNA uridine-5-carboxymethylaminomethyl(34) synthesis GTPase MnmE [Caulobacteraceae bacterium]|jgi:tRNA modification GTPase|nr:tRNA uridine-5-carboxymethylaminomethyl(34) synthesis GTPase MnmE [Caulobacteraceae bacterium]
MTDTIFALATAPGRAAVAIVRLSGPRAGSVLRRLSGGGSLPRKAVLRTLRGPGSDVVLDRALVIWFPGPDSYTGEDCAEFHVHGGAAVVDGLVKALLELGPRLAEPGEFTRRAFENGKLDLTQAEAVADLVDAETDAQRRQALAQLDGDLARRHAAWREVLVDALAVLEAAVDFPDEEVPETIAEEAGPALSRLTDELGGALADADRGERIRDGYRIALVGAPNAGKSSLLNALVGKDAAIVTPIPGTTRDVIEVPLTLGGFRVWLSDTAGVRDTADPVEAEGVRRARASASGAALRLWVVDGAFNGAWKEARGSVQTADICVISKADLVNGDDAGLARRWAEQNGLEVVEASVTGAPGLDALRGRLLARVTDALSGAEFPAATQARHRQALTEAQVHLDRAIEVLRSKAPVELAAEDVRLAARSLARISGRIDAEQVLDRVFARFCIGK